MSLAAGTSFGPYRIIEPLGKGGMASVYKAYEAGLDRFVALKVLPGEFLHDNDFSERFNREARLIAKLEHPNIIPIYNFGIDEPTRTPWISLRLISGGALSGFMKSGRLSHARVVEILHGSASALDYAHSRGVVHRDVKPQNILLDEAERVYLADFGIARMLEGSAALTQAGMITGTPQYMAPEQATGQQLDNRADIYALGVVAYEMLVGRVPFSADTPIAVLMKHVQEPLPLPPSGEVPEGMARALLKALAKSPAERWPTAVAFVDALRQGMAESYGAPATVGFATPPASRAVTQQAAMPPTMPPRPPTQRAPVVPPPMPGYRLPPPSAGEPEKSRAWLFAGLALGALVMGVGGLALLLVLFAGSVPDPAASPSPTSAPVIVAGGGGAGVQGGLGQPEVDTTPAPVAVDEPQPVPTPTPLPVPEEPRPTPRPRVVPAPPTDEPTAEPASTATAILRLDIDAQQGTFNAGTDVLFMNVVVDGRTVRSMTLVFSGKDAFQRSRKRETFEVPGVPVGTRRVSLVVSPDRNMGRDVARGTAELLIEEGVNRAYAQVRFMGRGSGEVNLR